MPGHGFYAAPAQGALSSGGAGSGIGALSGLQSFGLVMAAAGAIQSSIGAYYSALSQRYQLRSRALDMDFQASMAGLNAQMAERDAQATLEAGKHQKALSTLRYGQAKSASRVRQAAAGVQAGVGSAGEVQASIEAAKELDSLTIERNALRAAGTARTRAQEFRNRALLARTAAGNLRRIEGTINPGFSAFTSLLGGAGQVSSSYLYQQSFLQNMGGR